MEITTINKDIPLRAPPVKCQKPSPMDSPKESFGPLEEVQTSNLKSSEGFKLSDNSLYNTIINK
jgi:hypothetical protein